jgi:hypothetical protein
MSFSVSNFTYSHGNCDEDKKIRELFTSGIKYREDNNLGGVTIMNSRGYPAIGLIRAL